MNNYIQPGKHITVPAAPAALASGQAILIGSLFGVASQPAGSGAEVVLVTEGVFELPKVSALAVSQGDALYWSTGSGNLSKTAASNYLVGFAAADAANPSATVRVRLSGAPVLVTAS